MHALIEHHRQQIADLCRKYGVRRLEAFGSILREDFDLAGSDVDIVVDFDTQAAGSRLHRYFGFKAEMESLLARPVDLVELAAMPDTRLKRIIQRSKVPVYAEAA